MSKTTGQVGEREVGPQAEVKGKSEATGHARGRRNEFEGSI